MSISLKLDDCRSLVTSVSRLRLEATFELRYQGEMKTQHCFACVMMFFPRYDKVRSRVVEQLSILEVQAKPNPQNAQDRASFRLPEKLELAFLVQDQGFSD